MDVTENKECWLHRNSEGLQLPLEFIGMLPEDEDEYHDQPDGHGAEVDHLVVARTNEMLCYDYYLCIHFCLM